jgi:hypothetical protein
MSEKSRVLVLDLLESFVRERDLGVRIERRRDDPGWVCTIVNGVPEVQATGSSAREAIKAALEEAGVEIPT